MIIDWTAGTYDQAAHYLHRGRVLTWISTAQVLIVTAPRVVFTADLAQQALVSTLDVLSWSAAATPQALSSAARDQAWVAAAAAQLLTSTLDVFSWTAAAAPQVLTSQPRDVT